MDMVQLTRDVYCPFTEAVPLIQRFYRTVPVRIGPFAFMEFDVEADVVETRDYTDETRIHDALAIRWRRRGGVPAPSFSGLITARPNGPSTEIRIEGHYTPPLGVLGAIFDAVIGKHIARWTLERFLDQIAAFINHEFGKERMMQENW